MKKAGDELSPDDFDPRTASGAAQVPAYAGLGARATRRPADPAPFAGNLILSAYPGMTVSGALPAEHLVGNPLRFAVVAAPIHGAVVVVDPAAGRFTYTASLHGVGGDSFIFTATDTVTGHVSNLGMVTVIVAKGPDPI